MSVGFEALLLMIIIIIIILKSTYKKAIANTNHI
ncbi:hypothetical protein J2W57_002321 [Chryseobacterium ginsenosidimutans]|uniref:Uncharacterized protein n=1 Tax=Chryseobacterium geocarposphaerae TaxID=1416776 RepID=A0ABU1LGP2_9FLAO|nr:hypothetical protein [Chryseobacterium geocarposphaerae]MDR6698944.1 hypothetical protein [Chryseobacterium ginsenosidimutans]